MFDRKSLAIGLLLGVCLCLLAALLSDKQEAHAQAPRTAQQPPPPIPLLRVRRLEIVNEQGKVQAEFYTVTEKEAGTPQASGAVLAFHRIGGGRCAVLPGHPPGNINLAARRALYIPLPGQTEDERVRLKSEQERVLGVPKGVPKEEIALEYLKRRREQDKVPVAEIGLKVHFRCLKCSHEYAKDRYDLTKAQMFSEADGPIRDGCPKCGAQGSAIQLAKCPKCEKYYLPKFFTDQRVWGQPGSNVCEYCKIDVDKWYMEDAMKRKSPSRTAPKTETLDF